MKTYYIVKKDGKVEFYNRNSACFAEIVGDSGEYSIFIHFDSRYVGSEILVQTDPSLTKQEIQTFLKKVSTFGVKASIVELTKEQWEQLHPYSEAKGNSYLFEIKGSDYSCPKFLKFSIHVLRSLVEDPHICKQYVSKKTPVGLDNFQFFRVISSVYPARHDYFGYITAYDYGKMDSKLFKGNYRFKEIADKIKDYPWHSVSQRVASYNRPDKYIQVPSKDFPDNKDQLIKFLSKLSLKHS